VLDGDRLPAIEASRVVLRWPTDRDVEALYAIFSDPQVMRYWSTPPLENLAAAAALLAEMHAHFRDRTLFQWGIARKADDRLIGTCTLFHLEKQCRRAEIGFAVGREHWRRGYAGEALRALIDHAFDELDLNRIEADVDPRNAASIRTLERLGFRREGQLRERWIVAGEIQDALFYGLLRREWSGGA